MLLLGFPSVSNECLGLAYHQKEHYLQSWIKNCKDQNYSVDCCKFGELFVL